MTWPKRPADANYGPGVTDGSGGDGVREEVVSGGARYAKLLRIKKKKDNDIKVRMY